MQGKVEKLVIDRLRIDDEQRLQIGIDPAEKGKLHQNPARDRDIRNAGALGLDRACVVVKHQYDDLVGKCQVFQDFMPSSRAELGARVGFIRCDGNELLQSGNLKDLIDGRLKPLLPSSK